jgi:hypothetical protein
MRCSLGIWSAKHASLSFPLPRRPARLGIGLASGRDYVDQEAKAKTERLGIHAHDCQPAWEGECSRSVNVLN